MAYKPITDAPTCPAPTGRMMLLPEPKNVRSCLRRLGYEWQPGVKLLVRFAKASKIDEAYAYIGHATMELDGATFYRLRGRE